MPRKKLTYIHNTPYHITARSNNKEWFSIPIGKCWKIFNFFLSEAQKNYGLQIHGFILLNNHYHLLASTSSPHHLSEVMCWLQTSVSRTINSESGRMNHVFGGTYKASVINSPEYYYNAYKYVLRNAVDAGLAQAVENYKYSTIHNHFRRNNTKFLISKPKFNLDCYIPYDSPDFLSWLNKEFRKDHYEDIKKAIIRSEFKLINRKNRRKPHDLLIDF